MCCKNDQKATKNAIKVKITFNAFITADPIIQLSSKGPRDKVNEIITYQLHKIRPRTWICFTSLSVFCKLS